MLHYSLCRVLLLLLQSIITVIDDLTIQLWLTYEEMREADGESLASGGR